MTVVVITEARTEKDLAAVFPAPDCDWVLVRTVEAAQAHAGADLYIDLDFTNEPARREGLSRLLPALVMVNAVVPTLAEIGFPFVRINGWAGFLERPIHEVVIPDGQPGDSPEKQLVDSMKLITRLKRLYEKSASAYRLVPDTPGMVSGRILATIVNEAYYTWEADVSTIEEIDIAMKLGTNYPLGPFEWSRLIGLEKIAALLVRLSIDNTRYTPASSLLAATNLLKYD